MKEEHHLTFIPSYLQNLSCYWRLTLYSNIVYPLEQSVLIISKPFNDYIEGRTPFNVYTVIFKESQLLLKAHPVQLTLFISLNNPNIKFNLFTEFLLIQIRGPIKNVTSMKNPNNLSWFNLLLQKRLSSAMWLSSISSSRLTKGMRSLVWLIVTLEIVPIRSRLTDCD